MIKRLMIAGLSALSLTAIATPSFAGEIVALKNNSAVIREVSPVNLVDLGYQGYFQEQGIPSGSSFVIRANSGRISAKDLVRSAIEKGRLSPEKLNDLGYLNIVQSELNTINQG